MRQCKECEEIIHFILSAKKDPDTGQRKPIPCNRGEKAIVTHDGKVIKGFTPHHAT